MRWAAVGLALVVGWFFILWQNDFHLTAPVVFVALGYLAVVALIVNMWKTGAMAVAPEQAGDEAWERPIGPREELEKEKRTLLKAIKEAEFDHQMGKLSKVDADAMIATYRQRAIAVIKELDLMDPRTTADEAYRGTMLTKREKIEREVKARLELAEKKQQKAKNKQKKNHRQDAEGAKQKSQAVKQPEAKSEAKQADAANTDATKAADNAEAAQADDKAEAGKAETAKADDKAETAKPDDKAETAKAETAKAETAKAETAQADDKAEAGKADETAAAAQSSNSDAGDKASAEATK
ncbi:MAG: hypothetical protein ACM31C_25390 [Acidobacteriota bacterium]